MRFEILLCLLGLYTSVALMVRAGAGESGTWIAISLTGAYVIVVETLRRNRDAKSQKLRCFCGYLFVLLFFLSVRSFVVSMQLPSQDRALMGWDTRNLGSTPSVHFQVITFGAMTELMSGLYLAFLVYLHVALAHALVSPLNQTRRFCNWIFSVYAISLPAYLLMPALGPGRAFPDLYDVPLGGYLLTGLNQRIVEGQSTSYNVFPSLHVLITGSLLMYDFRYCRARFRHLWIPAIGTCVAAVYLRYHYGVDFFAAVAWFVVAWLLLWERRPRDVAAA